eukprot:TRINITY_DN1771_c0_g1_i1.p4 TRINITY_DN1771_c0_g1~~TRINITY_DN1771_c0_g1_i1.p4  ORF type:complete len:483 (+),score=67.99 TRINITY_DN1771_c0_g1_i1:181-1629(+)
MSDDMGGLFDFDNLEISTPAQPEETKAAVAPPEETKEVVKEELTTEPDRKLAFIAKIEKIEPIKGSETLEVATILGWTVVVKKNGFKPGDLCVYFTIGSVPDPTNPAFDFLKVKGKMKQLKSKKVKGIVSQGAIVPLSTLTYYGMDPTKVQVGDDVSNQIKTRKAVSEEEADVYVKDLPDQEPFPDFVPQTDEERIQNIPDIIKEIMGLKVVITRKEDGCSATYAFNNGRFYPCSRNCVWNKRTKPSSQIYQTMEKYKIKEQMTKLGRNIAVQGEILGPGILNNRLGLKDKIFRVFNIWDIDEQVYVGHDEMVEIAKKLGLDTVPVIYTGVYPKEWATVEDLLKYAETIEYYEGCPAEGIVIKNDNGKKEKRISFKAVSNKYLTHFHLQYFGFVPFIANSKHCQSTNKIVVIIIINAGERTDKVCCTICKAKQISSDFDRSWNECRFWLVYLSWIKCNFTSHKLIIVYMGGTGVLQDYKAQL